MEEIQICELLDTYNTNARKTSDLATGILLKRELPWHNNGDNLTSYEFTLFLRNIYKNFEDFNVEEKIIIIALLADISAHIINLNHFYKWPYERQKSIIDKLNSMLRLLISDMKSNHHLIDLPVVDKNIKIMQTNLLSFIPIWVRSLQKNIDIFNAILEKHVFNKSSRDLASNDDKKENKKHGYIHDNNNDTQKSIENRKSYEDKKENKKPKLTVLQMLVNNKKHNYIHSNKNNIDNKVLLDTTMEKTNDNNVTLQNNNIDIKANKSAFFILMNAGKQLYKKK